jgi:1,4-alpha-glucan branching enzyme
MNHPISQAKLTTNPINTMAKARKSTHPSETFTLHAPDAVAVLLVGSFTDWEQHSIPLRRDSNGTWTVAVRLQPGKHEYLFIVDGAWCSDPACAPHVANPFGTENMLREVPSGHAG